MLKFKIILLLFVILQIIQTQSQGQEQPQYEKIAEKADLTTEKSWIEGAIAKHNEYRKKHGAPPLVHNEEISKISQYWANELAKNKEFKHDIKYNGLLGENLSLRSSSRSLKPGESVDSPPTFKITNDDAVTDWYNEIQDYDFDKGESKNDKAIGHFTQVVWKGSREMGTAYAYYNEIKLGMLKTTYIVVANYYPPGNYQGQYQSNVLSNSGKSQPQIWMIPCLIITLTLLKFHTVQN